MKALVVADAPDRESWLRQSYVATLLAMLDRGDLALMPGEVVHVDVYHDDGCPALDGGVCNCESDVRVRGDPRCN